MTMQHIIIDFRLQTYHAWPKSKVSQQTGFHTYHGMKLLTTDQLSQRRLAFVSITGLPCFLAYMDFTSLV